MNTVTIANAVRQGLSLPSAPNVRVIGDAVYCTVVRASGDRVTLRTDKGIMQFHGRWVEADVAAYFIEEVKRAAA